MKTKLKTVKTYTAGLMLVAFTFVSLGFSPDRQAYAATTWDTTGNYVINLNHMGTDHPHDMYLMQDASDNLTGNGGSPAGSNTYTWVITSGSVTGNAINFSANYTATPDAVTPQTTMHVAGMIAEDGRISGTWSDNYQGEARSGTISTVTGRATTDTTPSPVNGYVATTPATNISQTNATMNGMNGMANATGHSFWISENTFSTADPYTNPSGVYGTSNLGAIAANTPFSASMNSTGVTISPDTTYYFVAWSYVDGEWYPGQVLNFTTGVPYTGPNGPVNGPLNGDVVGNTGELEVTSIEMVDSTATANNSFEDGWEYVFHITVPTDETNLSMKFADWMRTGGSGMIPAANNMRISSAQANNGGATILITAANTYSTPALTMTTDLNPNMDGIQVEVTVEVKIPTGTPNGSYTTSYGVQSQ